VADLRLTDTFEKKKNHLFWFSGLAIIVAIGLWDSPGKDQIDVFKSGVEVQISHIGWLLAVILLYEAISFYFEDRKVTLINSELTRRGDFGDAKEVFEREAGLLMGQARERMEAVATRATDEQFTAGYEVVTNLIERLQSMDGTLEQFESRYHRWSVNDNEGIRAKGELGLQLGIAEIRAALEHARQQLGTMDLANLERISVVLNDTALANERLERATTAIQSDLTALLKNLYAVRGDLSRMDRLQLLLFERWVPYVVFVLGMSSSIFLICRGH
jgi:hypothetical protein